MVSALAGLWAYGGRVSAALECGRQLGTQHSFGDDPQLWGDERFALGRRIIRSLPEDRFDAGPVIEGAGNYALVADVRLDNRAELALDLNLGMGQLNQLSDSSLLLKCLLAWGETTLDRLVGDFAFAFWDRDRNKLTLARDYSGQRPLHYATGPGFFAWASMPSGLHAVGAVERTPSRTSAIRFMHHQSPPPGESAFEGIAQVPPGHVLTVRDGALETRRWWNFTVAPDRPRQTLDECAEQARELLELAVESRLRGGGLVVATHLSAGLDSTAVTATAARILQRERRGLLAYTAVPQQAHFEPFGDGIADESALARLVADRFDNVEHLTVGGAGSLLGAFERNVNLWERLVPNPINDLWWSDITQKAAKRGASVLLTAPMGNLGFSHAGDEIFSELLVSFRWIALARALADSRRVRGPRANRLALSMVASHLPRPLWAAVQKIRGRRATPDFLSAAGLVAHAGETDDFDGPPKSVLRRRLSLLATIDPGAFNAGAAAGWGVDMRDALADRRLMEFALSLPTAMFFDRGESRALARRALADRLPEQVLREYRKGYQAADWVHVLDKNRPEMMAEAEAIGASPAAEVIDAPALLEALRIMPQQDWSSARTRHVYGRSLVGALSAGHFLRSTRT